MATGHDALTEPATRHALPDLAAWCTDAFDAQMVAGRAWLDIWREACAEILALWQSRTKETVAAGVRLAACESVSATTALQSEYLRVALHAHLDHGAKMNHLMWQVVAGGVTIAPPGTSGRVGR